MARIIIELTNRCNLRCQHCFADRHAATGELPMSILETVLGESRSCGIDHLCFTGGEPSLHRHFQRIIERVCAEDYTFSFVSNGLNFHKLAPLLLQRRQWFRGVTFSLDGAREPTHDAIRGKGSYRQVMRAATICAFRQIPFTLNMVLTAQNCGEIDEMVDLAARLGSAGIRFGHLMFSADTDGRGLDLTPLQRRSAEARIWALKKGAPVFVGMAPGYYSESPFFPCAPLELEEFNLDYKGNVTLCCHLSGYAGANDTGDVIANLGDVGLAEACRRVRARVATYLADKQDRVSCGDFGDLDHFPCWYCVKYLGKVAKTESFPATAWASTDLRPTGGKLHVLASHAPSGC